MSFYLRTKGIKCTINAQYRKPEIAHRWSTAFSIVSGQITLDELRILPEGRDLDGNLWFCPDWEKMCPDGTQPSVCDEVIVNAKKLGPKNPVYAEEGYSAEDARRLPNLKGIPVSRHVTGCAIDLDLQWFKLGGEWSRESNQLLSLFGLKRPFPHEHWHVELDR